MKIYSRPIIVYYVVLFSALAPYFVYLSYSLNSGTSAVDKSHLLYFINDNIILLLFSALSMFLSWKMSKFAKILVGLMSLICLAFSMNIAFQEFNKVILVMDFFFIVTAYYLLMVYSVEIFSAPYNPLYVKSTIGQRSEYDLPCSLKLSSLDLQGTLTNWDEQGCYISLINNDSVIPESTQDIEVETRIGDVHFHQAGKIVSTFEGGVGIRFSMDTKIYSEGYNWSEYFKIIDHRGFSPRSKSI